MKLGVNVDHIATLRQARGTLYPDPVVAALLAEYGGCDSIVVHLREDRRHIQERDVILIQKTVKLPLNLEMSINKSIVDFACEIIPQQATLVPEKRQELTTEGGIDLLKHYKRVARAIKRLKMKGIRISLFVDPVKKQAAAFGHREGLFVAAGHGLDYENVKHVSKIKEIKELNIGHSIICRSLFIGAVAAVEEMLLAIRVKKG